jgi:hypothetical protein
MTKCGKNAQCRMGDYQNPIKPHTKQDFKKKFFPGLSTSTQSFE